MPCRLRDGACAYFAKHREMLPSGGIGLLRRFAAIYLGPFAILACRTTCPC